MGRKRTGAGHTCAVAVRFPLGPRRGGRQTGRMLDHDRCYGLLQTRDHRFDGWFVTAVRTTGIYCRPSCPAVMPKAHNVEFFPTAAAAQQRGYRACKRCRPDASPGSPEWDVRGDVVARAMRLIADGVVDREGVHGLARRLSYSERHLTRVITDSSAPARSPLPEPSARTRHARCWRRPICASSTSPMRRGSAACASSTTPCERCSPRRPRSCGPAVAAGTADAG